MVSRYWASGSAQLVALVATIIVEQGQKEIMSRARIDETDVLAAAREAHGLERMDQIKYAVLETSGGISIIPRVL